MQTTRSDCAIGAERELDPPTRLGGSSVGALAPDERDPYVALNNASRIAIKCERWVVSVCKSCSIFSMPCITVV